MNLEDSPVEFLEDLDSGSSVLEGNVMCVGSTQVEIDHGRSIAIGFVERAGKVDG